VPVAPVDETQPLPARLTFAWTATGIALGSTAGPPSAWEGTLELERPRTGAERRGWVLAAIGFALVALAVFALRARGASRRRGAPPTPSPTN
jgi:predicted cobalt transporter CbtA